MKKTYKKHNSFFGLRVSDKKSNTSLINKIKLILSDKKYLKEINLKNLNIIEKIKKDLFDNNNISKNKFQLTENVIQEIKTINVSKIPQYLIHRYRYEIFPQKKIVDDFPPYLQIEPTSICNFRCVFCYQTDSELTKRSNGHMGRMSIDTFKLIVDQAVGNIEFISLASRGEPLLCPDIIPMLDYTRDKFLNLKINTNASLLSEKISHSILQSGVKTLVFSADAADEKLYSKLRVNGKLDKVLSNIKNFKKIKEKHYKDSKIITRVSGVKVEEAQNLDDMQKLWGDLVDQVAFVNYVPWENVYNSEKTKIDQPCSDLWRRMFVWWDGKINPCDVDFKSTLLIGSSKNNNLSQLWKSNAYENLRNLHFDKKRDLITPCDKCNVI